MMIKDRGSGEASFPDLMPPLFCFFAGALFGTSGIAQVNRRYWLQLAHRPLATASGPRKLALWLEPQVS